VIAVHVSYEDLCIFVEAGASYNHLPLHALTTVKKQLLTLTLYQNGWQTSFRGWNAARRAQKDNLNVHETRTFQSVQPLLGFTLQLNPQVEAG
jgi:hypothetical protein